MTRPRAAAPAPDEGPTRFQVRAGIRLVSCTVADEALEDASSLALPSTALSRRKSFDRFRALVHAAAVLKLGELPPDFGGPLLLSSRDLRRVPPVKGGPAYGSGPRGI